MDLPKNLLYDRPRLYDLVFPDAEKAIETMCRAAFARYLPASPTSVLDVGCGTGRHLEGLATMIAECWGVDYLESNVAYARAARPTLVIRPGDMRDVLLGWTFGVAECLGITLLYGLT